MPELTLAYLGMLVAAILAGFVLGWVLRHSLNLREKVELNAGWQAQIDSQQNENERLTGQNLSLMEQVSKYQTTQDESTKREQELSESLREAFARRDELQRQMKDIRSNLEVAIIQRDELKSDATANAVDGDAVASSLQEKDEQIRKLQKDLASWYERVPQLIKRYRKRDRDALQLESELRLANEHIETLESMARGEHTRIEPVGSSSLPDGMEASNEPHAATSVQHIMEPGKNVSEQADDRNEGPADGHSGTADVGGFPNILDDSRVAETDAPDDLKQIKGIGPAIAKTLTGLGIHRFSQIAEMSEYEIDRVAQELKGFRSRIYREDWIGQARTLQYQKNNGPQPA